MMVEFKWISLFLPAVLQFTAAAGKLPPSFTVRVGDEVTLPCENVKDGQQECEYTTWLFDGSGNTAAVELVELGQIVENAKSKSDRLSVTENCSLVIKKVTVEDVGRYTCRQIISGQHQTPDFLVLLSVITMTEEDADEVTLWCSVSTHEQSCRHTVKWLYEGKDVDKDIKEMKTGQGDCYAAVSFLDSHFSYKSKSNLKCEVTDGYSGKVQLFTFSPQSSGEKTVYRVWWWYVAVAALLITVVIVVGFIRWKKTKGKKTQMDENTGRSLNPAVSPESSQDTADPEDGVSYASISYTRKTNSKGRVLGKDGDDEDDAVTYSTVKASSSSAGASADPSDLYANVN